MEGEVGRWVEGEESSIDNLIESTVEERETDGWRVRVTSGWRVMGRAQTT